MFLRFTTRELHEYSHAPLGLFYAASRVRRAADVALHENLWYDDVVGWFSDHLYSPEWWEFDVPGSGYLEDRVIFWFRDSAHIHIQMMRHMMCWLAHFGVDARVVRSPKPGRVVYEDCYQVAAIPYRDSAT